MFLAPTVFVLSVSLLPVYIKPFFSVKLEYKNKILFSPRLNDQNKSVYQCVRDIPI